MWPFFVSFHLSLADFALSPAAHLLGKVCVLCNGVDHFLPVCVVVVISNMINTLYADLFFYNECLNVGICVDSFELKASCCVDDWAWPFSLSLVSYLTLSSCRATGWMSRDAPFLPHWRCDSPCKGSIIHMMRSLSNDGSTISRSGRRADYFCTM